MNFVNDHADLNRQEARQNQALTPPDQAFPTGMTAEEGVT